MPKLHAPLNKVLDEPISELQVQRIWRNAQSPSEPKWQRKDLQLGATICILIAALVATILLRG